MDTSSRISFLVNPAAGAGRSGRTWAQREVAVRRAFPQADILFTHAPGEAQGLAEAAARRGQELVVAVGGDGTLHEVVNGLMRVPAEERPILGVLPCGSGADFARGQGIPNDPAEALALLQEGTPRPVDIGCLHCADGPPRYFLNAADCGVGARVVERMQSRRRRLLPARGSYLWQSVLALLAWRNPWVHFCADNGDEERVRVKTLVLANNAYFGGGMCIAPEARIDSGHFAFVVFGDLGRLEAVRRLGETYGGKRIEHERIHYRESTRLEVWSEQPIPVEADGELVGHLPLTAEIVPAALCVILP